MCGANGEARTLDLLFTKQLLYQLSYIGVTARIVAKRDKAVKLTVWGQDMSNVLGAAP